MKHPSHRFVNDLIPLILESHNYWWPRDLVLLARISSSWLPHARRRLYVCPALYTFRACFLLARSLQGNANLVSYIRGVDLKPTLTNADQLEARELAGVRYLLGLEGLQSIALGGELAVRSERFLQQIGFPESVTQLTIDGSLYEHKLNSPASLEWDDGMSCRFSCLKTLRLSSIVLDVSYTSKSLSLSDIFMADVEIDGFLSSLVNSSYPVNLAVTDNGRHEWDADQLRAVMAECRVESFLYEVRGGGLSQRPGFSMENVLCPSMRHLTLRDVDMDYGDLLVTAQAFPNLRSLDLEGRYLRITPDEWCAFISSGTLRFLQNLGLSLSTDLPRCTAWTETCQEVIQAAASSRQLHLSWHK